MVSAKVTGTDKETGRSECFLTMVLALVGCVRCLNRIDMEGVIARASLTSRKWWRNEREKKARRPNGMKERKSLYVMSNQKDF